MNVQINQLVKSLLQKDSLEQCSVQELEQYADRHPYFGAAQLLLAKKLQVENSDRYNDQLQKTLLFFNNSLWVQHLLNGNGNATVTHPKKEEVSIVQKQPEMVVETVENAVIEKESETITPAVADPVPEATAPAQEAKEPAINVADLKVEKAVKDIPLFQPYYTVDYFASQGIKNNEDEKPKDKFSQQLKSFTEWLKTMKPIQEATAAQQSVSSSEEKVVQMAEASIKDESVVTEAMAEVWEKQKNYPKAIDIYNKLSLLEPAKSAYFAARIEELKKLS